MSILKSEIAGNVWKIQVALGDQVSIGDVVLILESMKMEIPIEASAAGRVTELFVSEGENVAEEAPLLRLETT